MKFQTFNEFKPINEANERLKVKSVPTKNPNGESSFLIKFIGKSFDRPTVEAFLKNDPNTKTMIDKVNQFRDQYFIAYTTLADGKDRPLSASSTWSVIVELINAKKDNKIAYTGFNVPPYNNFVDYKDMEKFISTELAPTDVIVQATKDLAASAKTLPNPIASAEPVAQADGTKPVDGSTALPENPKPAEAPAQSMDDVFKGFENLKLNDKGPNVINLQKTVEIIARYQNNDNVMKMIARSIRPDGTGNYDGIYGPQTAEAFNSILGNDRSFAHLKQLATDAKVTPIMLAQMTPDQLESKKNLGKVAGVTPKGIAVNRTTNTTSNQIGTSVVPDGDAAVKGLTSVETRIGKIYYA